MVSFDLANNIFWKTYRLLMLVLRRCRKFGIRENAQSYFPRKLILSQCRMGNGEWGVARDKKNEWFWRFCWIDIFISQRVKSIAITCLLKSNRYINVVEQINKMKPQKRCYLTFSLNDQTGIKYKLHRENQ